MIEFVKNTSPDICFVDIRMPGVNGLEAIAELSTEYPSISWIILSGYSDFDYAREALKLGVIDYLLKPTTEKEVRIALQRAVERIEESGRRRERGLNTV